MEKSRHVVFHTVVLDHILGDSFVLWPWERIRSFRSVPGCFDVIATQVLSTSNRLLEVKLLSDQIPPLFHGGFGTRHFKVVHIDCEEKFELRVIKTTSPTVDWFETYSLKLFLCCSQYPPASGCP